MSEEPETISMVSCVYCGDNWVRQDTELVCKSCVPKLSIDLAVSDLVKAIETFKETPGELDRRFELLLSAHQALGEIIKKVKENG